MRNHDWWFMMADDPRAFSAGYTEMQLIGYELMQLPESARNSLVAEFSILTEGPVAQAMETALKRAARGLKLETSEQGVTDEQR